MVAFTILAGGYDTFIAAYLLNVTSHTLSLLNKYPTGPSPSWITLNPNNRSVLYAVNEPAIGEGALQSFTIIGPHGALSPAIATVPSGGRLPAFAGALSTNEVAVLNYGSGNGRIVPTSPPDAVGFGAAPLIVFPAPEGVGGEPQQQEQQKESHPHQAVEYKGEVFVPDLGGDKIWRLAKSGGRGRPGTYRIQGFIPQPKGSGPRHIAIHGNRLFTLHELTSTLNVQLIPPAPNGTTPVLSTVSIVPPNPPPNATFAAAEILIPPLSKRFPKTYIYASNRNTATTGEQQDQDPRGDTIAIFELVNEGLRGERLSLVRQVYTGLSGVRGMAVGPGKLGAEGYLVAAGVRGTEGVKVFKRTERGRNLEVVAQNRDVPTRTTFVWV